MKRKRRVLRGIAIVCFAYPLLLVLLGWLLEGVVEKRVRSQIMYTLRADEVTIGDVDVSLVRGVVLVSDLTASRKGIGTARLELDALQVDIAPMGLALVEQEPRRLEVTAAHLDLSAAGVATLRSSEESREISVGKFVMHDSRVTLSVTTLFPALGQVELTIDEARATDVELKNAVSWLYKTETLKAGLHLPGPMVFGVGYEDGNISVSGSIMGSVPITIPFAWPNPDPRQLELGQILSLAKDLVKRLGPEIAKRKAKGLWDEVVDSL